MIRRRWRSVSREGSRRLRRFTQMKTSSAFHLRDRAAYAIARAHEMRTLMLMRFEGKLARDGRFWLAEIPLLDAMTQGRTRAEALVMIGDWLETMVNRPGFRAQVYARGKNEFEVSGNDIGALTALLLRRRREASGISLREVAQRLGARSRNAY